MLIRNRACIARFEAVMLGLVRWYCSQYEDEVISRNFIFWNLTLKALAFVNNYTILKIINNSSK